MKKRLLFLPLLAIATSSISCNKKEDSSNEDKQEQQQQQQTSVKEKSDACILYTNDVHCALEEVVKEGNITQLGYTKVSLLKNDMIGQYGRDNVYLVDNGDHLQGAYFGTLSLGADIVKCMNAAGYDLAIPGNHEFDFGMETFLNYANNLAKYEYISTNFVHNGQTVFKPYKIAELGGRKIAFLGATTPDTYTSSTPKYFQDSTGKFVYTFSEGEGRTGTPLYETIQKTVDKVKNEEKADYVVLMAHLGIGKENSPYMSTDVIKNTTGIDVVLDGHSHSTIPNQTEKNKDGKDVLLTSTGTKLASVGKLTISKDGKLTSELITNYKNKIDDIIDTAVAGTSDVAATTDFSLTINDPDTNNRRVRKGETNLGDLVADGFQLVENSDFAFVNGGGVRNPVEPGNITLKNVMDFQPFSNHYDTYKTKGSNILDFLEYSCHALAQTTGTSGINMSDNRDEFGGYMQNSKGIKYSIDTTIPSPVVKDSSGKKFDRIEGTRRIHSVQVATEYNSDGTVKTWANLDPNKDYTFASTSYYVESGGDGYTMLKLGENCEKITKIEKLDWEVTLDYFKSFPKVNNVAKVPNQYSSPKGQGRVTYAKRPA